MQSTYSRNGIHFAFPESWRLETADASHAEQNVSVVSPDGAFWCVRLEPPDVSAAELISHATAAMQEEYPQLDVEIVNEEIAGQILQGVDMHFFCLDLTNTASLRIFAAEDATYVILIQAEDRQFELLRDVFRAITTSLICDG